ncbi:MAG: carboxypeptidase-like regulatory domain-containing protein, partial [Armatimonadetes bacterium]|nr:carboxypeptidase-like regulatory domain-containing protein [Armatimonadota bacterium]
VGKKPGETTANINRVYYTTVTYGLTAPPTQTATGPGTTTGDKPDFVATVELAGNAISRADATVHRATQASPTITPTISVTNQGAEYYGDLHVDVVVDGLTMHYHYPDYSGGTQPLFARDQTRKLTKIPRLTYRYEETDDWEPGETELTHPQSATGMTTKNMYTGLGRKTLVVSLDPGNLVTEANEDNNTCQVQYEVSEGRTAEDKASVTRPTGAATTVGYNDLAILGGRILANTEIAHIGLVQRPTEAKIIVGNPRQARLFRNVPVVGLLDGAAAFNHVIPVVNDTPRLHGYEARWLGFGGPLENDTAELCAGFLSVPLDLTNVAPGAHTLTLTVDPQDGFADLDRSNNSLALSFTVRPRGGTLTVTVVDKPKYDNPQTRATAGISKARVFLPGLFSGACDDNGVIAIPDVPPGAYGSETVWGHRLHWTPKYCDQRAEAGFTLATDGTAQALVKLQPPVNLVLQLVDEATGQPITESAHAKITYLDVTRPGSQVDNSCARPVMAGSQVVFRDMAPGSYQVVAGAYAYKQTTQTVLVQDQGEGQCSAAISLQARPRGTVAGDLKTLAGNAVPGAAVWLSGAPRSTVADDQGHYSIANVEASRDYTVMSRKRSYENGKAQSATVPANGATTVDLQMAQITEQQQVFSFDAVTWAMLEKWPGFDFGGGVSNQGYEVSAQFGEFKATAGVLYHTVEGQAGTTLNQVIIGFEGQDFWQSDVHTTWNPLDLISNTTGTLEEAILTPALGAQAAKATMGFVTKSAGPINWVYNYFQDDVDYTHLQDGEVVAAFSSQSGQSYENTTLIQMPSSIANIQVGGAFSGGQTVVRCDMCEVAQVEAGEAQELAMIRRRFYSPKMAVYYVGQPVDLQKLQITFYVTVLNEHLSPGPLYANSQNVLKWRPFATSDYNKLVFHAWPYNPLPE